MDNRKITSGGDDSGRLNAKFADFNRNSGKRKGKSGLLLLSLILFCSLSMSACFLFRKEAAAEPDAAIPETSVTYQVTGDNNNQLVGVVGEQKYKIDLPADMMCLRVIEQLDFDEDGFADALMENNACGGSGALNTYFFVSYRGEGFFQVTQKFGYSGDDPVVEKWNDKTSVLAESVDWISINEVKIEKERYILKDGEALLVESMNKDELAVLKEIRASEFSNPNEKKYLFFDLDGDGIDDKITCTYWERWGDVLIAGIEFSSGATMEALSSGCKRFGVLESKTNNVRDLVCGDDIILRWNGEKYE